eukprot:TRINITY_DN9132_c1_g1_i2.p1 TRINITY_DN9132_c1_g1~~TRINITY_DN9132_c1_g1_i2.p1  ORF type:complete len:361 (+),score=111.62 TRINITY_DN9132_c1_g1_i2:71-1084(+)
MAVPLMLGVSAVQNAGKVVGFLQGLQKVQKTIADPSVVELVSLWRSLETVNASLEMAVHLHARCLTHRLVDAAITQTRAVVSEVEDVLCRGMDADDDRPDSDESWRRWLSTRKQTAQLNQKIPQVQSRLDSAAHMLTLALTTVSACVQEEGRMPGAPLRFVRAAFDHAYSLFTTVKIGRMPADRAVATGEGFVVSPVGGGRSWASVGRVGVLLSAEPPGLVLRPVPQTSPGVLCDDEDEPADPVALPFSGMKTSLEVGSGVPTCGSHDLVFRWQSGGVVAALNFNAVAKVGDAEVHERGIPAEVFHMLVLMLVHQDAVDACQDAEAFVRERLFEGGV